MKTRAELLEASRAIGDLLREERRAEDRALADGRGDRRPPVAPAHLLASVHPQGQEHHLRERLVEHREGVSACRDRAYRLASAAAHLCHRTLRSWRAPEGGLRPVGPYQHHDDPEIHSSRQLRDAPGSRPS